jgi:pimeloyl-ACP methyl ester carboxylesterase
MKLALIKNRKFYHICLLSSVLISSCNNSQGDANKRSQEPKQPYPYHEEEVLYPNEKAGIKLAGTLTYPESKGRFPAVILIAGRGPCDRDETSAGHRPFLVLADYLTRQGIAVLRSDKRGVGKSGGQYDFLTTTKQDLAIDVMAAFRYLQNRAEIDPDQIGLIGHSEGAVVAAMVAVELPQVSFIVMLAGPGLNGGASLALQLGLVAGSLGINEGTIAKYKAILNRTMEILKHEPDHEIARSKITTIYGEYSAKISEDERARMRNIGYDFPSNPVTYADGMMSPGFYDFLMVEPDTIFRQVKCPVLALNGEKDLQVPAKEHLRAITMALKVGGNTDYTIKALPGLNHLFQSAGTGSPAEYEGIQETISPIALEFIQEWIVNHNRRKNAK